jgi:vacuolar-type H+-ATPase subunit H
MNEKRIQEVIKIESQAQQLLAAAQSEADKLPALAEAEAQELLERARATAEQEARQIMEHALAEGPAAAIMSAAEDSMRQMESAAVLHLEQAVAYVLDQVIGKA